MVTRQCQRRWARRGRGLADFAFSFALAGLAHVLGSLYRLSSWMARRTASAIRHRPMSPVRPCTGAAAGLASSATTHQPDGSTTFTPIVDTPDVCFEDIAGLDDAKREIRLRMILPVLYPERARRYRIRRGGGLLLSGPPGTAKPM